MSHKTPSVRSEDCMKCTWKHQTHWYSRLTDGFVQHQIEVLLPGHAEK